MACNPLTDNPDWYAIRDVAQLTGVKPVTLRAWQRRYQLLEPKRTEKGHRLYSQQHIELIQRIQAWLAKGVSIGKVKALLDADSAELSDALLPETTQAPAVDDVLAALAELHRGRAETVIHRMLKEYPLDVVERSFIEPIQTALSQVKKPLRSLQNGLFQSLMIAKLCAILQAENRAATRAQLLLVNSEAPGHLGAWIWAIQLAGLGMKVTVLDGVDDLRGLLVNPGLAHYQHLAIFANHLPSQAQCKAINTLAQRPEFLRCSPVLTQLLMPGAAQ